MRDLAAILKKLGTDEETLQHIKWLLEQDILDIQDLFSATERSTVESALTSMHAAEIEGDIPLANLAPSVITHILNGYGKKHSVQMSDNLTIKLRDLSFHLHPYGTSVSEYSYTYTVEVYVDGALVKSYSLFDTLTLKPYPETVSELFKKFAHRGLLDYCTVNFEKTQNFLEIGLQLRHAQVELTQMREVYTAWDEQISWYHVKPICKLILWCFETNHFVIYEALRQLIKLYGETVNESIVLATKDDMVFLGTLPGINYFDSIYIESPQGFYECVNETHSRHAETRAWAETIKN